MKRVDVFKRTNDDWYPAYLCGKEKMVCVSFTRTGPSIEGVNYHWRVCVWGADDMGMEKDFPMDSEDSAWNLFLEVIGVEYVDISSLKALGFVWA